MGKDNELPGPIRDKNPCRFCTDERHRACHDTCERHKAWKAEIERVKQNRKTYLRQLGVRFKTGI